MASERTESVEALLLQAKEAHATFEATELHGVYDQDWPRWYAEYAVKHGLGRLVGTSITIDRLAELLADSNADFERTEPRPADSWAAYTARRITTELR